MNTTIYTAKSRLRDPSAFLLASFGDLFGRRTWYLATQLARRNITATYRRAFLGYVWAVLPAVALALGLSLAAKNQIVQFGQTSISYTVYVLIGFVLWQTFIDALTGPMNALSESRNILARINVPKEALILGKVGEILFGLGAKAILVAFVLAWYGMGPSWQALLVPVGVITIVALGTALGLILTPVGLLYDDVRRMVPLAAQVGLIITPVVFVPPSSGTFSSIVMANPITPLIVTTRDWLTGQPAILHSDFWVITGCTLFLLIVGFLGVRLVAPFAIERISS
jgi:lipopolysaccharide transport system permease protein